MSKFVTAFERTKFDNFGSAFRKLQNQIRDKALIFFNNKSLQTMSDREALLELFRSTKGRFWTRKDNWVSDEPYRKWFGITISSSGHVATLDLKRNYLQDRIDSVVSWKRLTNLQTLCLMDNKISGTIPEAIGDLPALEELDLSWNIMEGLRFPAF